MAENTHPVEMEMEMNDEDYVDSGHQWWSSVELETVVAFFLCSRYGGAGG